MRNIKKAAALAVVSGLVLVSAGCSSADADGSADGGDVVTIGVVGAYSGFAGAPEGVPDAMAAWEESVNADGGINGTEVRVIVKDVGTATGAGRTAVQQLISEDDVVAIISGDGGDMTWLPLAEQESVPVLYAYQGVSQLTSDNVFSVSQSPIALSYSIASTMGDSGGVGAVGYPAELAVAGQITAIIEQFADELGVELPVTAKMASSQPDHTAYCQQLKDSGVTANLLVFGAEMNLKIVEQCVAQGVETTQLLQGAGVADYWMRTPEYDGAVVLDNNAPFFDESVPGIKAYRDALAEYAPELLESAPTTALPLGTWAAAQMFLTAASGIDGGITGASVRGALYAIEDETLGGLIPPVTYTEGEITSIDCWFVWSVQDGELVTSNDSHPVCAPDGALDDAEAALVAALGS